MKGESIAFHVAKPGWRIEELREEETFKFTVKFC